MSSGSEEGRLIRQPSAQETATGAGTSEKRKQQNRAAQKTYREKRKRKLQELEELTSRSGPSNATAPTDMLLVTPQSSTAFQPPEFDTLNPTENSDWFFDFISPAAVDVSPPSLSPSPTTTTTITRRLSFPSLPTPSQRALLAAKVSAAYTHSRTPNRTPCTTFNPYANTLTLTTLSFAAGFFANALACGATDNMYCSPSAQSSFYRPGIADSPYAETMMIAASRSFDGLKPDLRPTPVQIITSHHPAIDFFPFPSLRRRLIEGLAKTPPALNEEEFWEDVRADGMVWWGNVEAVGGGGVPWDARSWEARGWFLEKWVGVLGEEEDELWRASRWWKEGRGEDW